MRARGVLICLFLALVVFRVWLAATSDIWGDEFAWSIFGFGSLANNLKTLAANPIPNDPLDLVLWELLTKPVMKLGLGVNIAFRLIPLLFSTLTCLLPWVSRVFTKREKWMWLFWASLHGACTAMAFNGRPYAGLIFFSSCALFAGVLLSRAEAGRVDGSIWIYLLPLLLGPLNQLYVLFPIFCLMGYTLISKVQRPQKSKVLSTLTASVLVFAFWFVVLRKPTQTLPPLGLSQMFTAFTSLPLSSVLAQMIGTLCNGDKRFVLVLPLMVWGLWELLNEKSSRTLALYIVAALAFSVLVPILLDLRYQYFFVPRQLLAAVPFAGWLLCIGLDRAASRLRPHRLSQAAIAMVLVVFGGTSTYKVYANLPPYFDQVRRKYARTLEHVRKDQKILILSWCEGEAISRYSGAEGLTQYFSYFARGEPLPEKQIYGETPYWWKKSDTECGGTPP